MILDTNKPFVRLSLCIPTYNRAALLREALKPLMTQWENDLTETQREQIELVISDNHSPDETPEVIVHLRSAYPCLRLNHFRQPENLGAGANVVFVIQKAIGEYVYVLSDDDVLLPGFLSHLFALMTKYPDMDAFCLNARTFEQDVQEPTPPVFCLSEDRIIKNPDEALRFLGTWITFLSVMVFRRAGMEGRDYTNRAETTIPQSYPFLDVLACRHGILITKEPFLAVRGNNTGGYNFFEIFVTQFQCLMNYAQTIGYSSNTAGQVFQRHLRTFLFPFVLSTKRRSFGTLRMNYRDGAQRMLKAYGANPFLLLVVLPLLFAPPALIRAGFALRRSLKLMKAKSGKS
jgi:abequosyltransferase